MHCQTASSLPVCLIAVAWLLRQPEDAVPSRNWSAPFRSARGRALAAPPPAIPVVAMGVLAAKDSDA